MSPAFLADLIVVVHLAIVLFVISGWLVILVGGPMNWSWIGNGWFRAVHLGTIVFVAIQGALGRLCFLTIWEANLRQEAGQGWDSRSFVARLAQDILYVDVDQQVLTQLYVLVALLIAICYIAFPPRWTIRRSRTTEPALQESE